LRIEADSRLLLLHDALRTWRCLEEISEGVLPKGWTRLLWFSSELLRNFSLWRSYLECGRFPKENKKCLQEVLVARCNEAKSIPDAKRVAKEYERHVQEMKTYLD